MIMAYDITVSKESVSQVEPQEFNVSIKVVISNAGVTLLDRTYSKRYKQGDTLASVKAVLLSKVKVDWDILKAEQAVYNNALFGTMCSEIQTTIGNYIN
jgi:hypothetical protein